MLRKGILVLSIAILLTGEYKAQAAGRSAHWQLELENRDNPLKVDADLDLKAKQPEVLFHTVRGDFAAQNVRFDGKNLAFYVPKNPLTGEGHAVAVVENGRIQGVLGNGDKRIAFHGRLKDASGDGNRRRIASRGYAGPGFRTLKIKASGAEWSLSCRMLHYHVPGLTLARIEHFAVAELGYYGVTSVEAEEPIDADNLFQVGEMGSPLVNIAALRLAAQRVIDLKEEANRYLKSWKIPDNKFTATRKITVADLIDGTSGLTQYKFTGYRPDAHCPTLMELLLGADRNEMEPVEPRSAPGSQFASAGINQAVLQLLLTDVTGKSFPELMQQLVFKPLTMPHSGYRVSPETGRTHTIAPGHYASGELMLDRFHIYPEMGASGLWTTAADYAQALCQLLRLLDGQPNAILSPDRRDLLQLVTTEKCILGYGRGKGNSLYDGGDSYGYYAESYISSVGGYGIVILQNRMGSWDLHNEIVKAVALEHSWSRP